MESPNVSEEIVTLVRAVRAHISETYRLHRRMLRNRRESVQLVSRLNPERSFAELKEEYDIDDGALELHELIGGWRDCSSRSIQAGRTDSESEQSQLLMQLFFLFFHSAGT